MLSYPSCFPVYIGYPKTTGTSKIFKALSFVVVFFINSTPFARYALKIRMQFFLHSLGVFSRETVGRMRGKEKVNQEV